MQNFRFGYRNHPVFPSFSVRISDSGIFPSAGMSGSAHFLTAFITARAPPDRTSAAPAILRAIPGETEAFIPNPASDLTCLSSSLSAIFSAVSRLIGEKARTASARSDIPAGSREPPGAFPDAGTESRRQLCGFGAGDYHDGISEIAPPAGRIVKKSALKYPADKRENVRMSALRTVEKHDRAGTAEDPSGKRTLVPVAYISGRRADEL